MFVACCLLVVDSCLCLIAFVFVYWRLLLVRDLLFLYD